MKLNDKIIVALDFQDKNEISAFLQKMQGEMSYVKVGMELFYSFGPDIIKYLQDQNLKVFLDLKLHDIPNTVYKSILTLGKLGVEMTNVHIAGGSDMLRAAREAANEYKTLLIGVTQLTSTTQEMLQKELLINQSMVEVVSHYAAIANNAGLNGVVCSALEAAHIKEKQGDHFLTITPGIRPQGSQHNDQKRVMTPRQAIVSGCDYLVIGRPINQSHEPYQVYQQILQEISS
jgi:orotidine-5'-phosphate decarboxylase